MIPKGNQRGGGQQLATHLLNAYDNDRVEIAAIRGSVAQDLHGAFAEWRAQSTGTQCTKYLYSLSVNPDHRQGPFKPEQYFDFIDRAEKHLGLSGQPRAVVFHVKAGREHCHVVWSRIDTENMRAVHMPHDRQKLRSVAQDFARDHGITLPQGMRRNRGLERFNEHARGVNLAEKQQEERSGTSKDDRRRAITECWRRSSDARTFIAALQQEGYYLARGDKRSYVVVDLYGEIHSLARQIEGAKTKHIRARLAACPLDKLPDAAAAQEHARRQREARAPKAPDKSNPDKSTGITPDDRKTALLQQHKIRRAALDAKRAALDLRHLSERRALKELQTAEDQGLIEKRLSRQPRGLAAFLARITGIRMILDARHRRQDQARGGQHRQQTAALLRRQQREGQEMARHYSSLSSVEKRELRSVASARRREEFRRVARPPEKQPQPGTQAPRQPSRIAEVFNRDARKPSPMKDLRDNAADITAPARQPSRIAEVFNRAARKPSPMKDLQDNAADITAPPAAPEPSTPSRLTEAFRERAAQKRRQKERDQEARGRGDTGREKHYRREPPDFASRR